MLNSSYEPCLTRLTGHPLQLAGVGDAVVGLAVGFAVGLVVGLVGLVVGFAVGAAVGPLVGASDEQWQFRPYALHCALLLPPAMQLWHFVAWDWYTFEPAFATPSLVLQHLQLPSPPSMRRK